MIFKTVLPISIAEELICSPNYWNSNPIFLNFAKLYLLIIPKSNIKSEYQLLHNFATKKIIYDLDIPGPYSRINCLTFRTKSISFYHQLLYWNFSKWYSGLVDVPIPIAPGIFPSNNNMGLYIDIPIKWNNQYFSKFMKIKSKEFSVSFWIYISEPCLYQYCNILSFYDNENEMFSSPVMLLRNTGKIHFQFKLKYSTSDIAFLTQFKIPIMSWNQIVFSIDRFKWSLSLFAADGVIIGTTDNNKFNEEIYINIIWNIGVFGGSQLYSGFHGFLSDIYLYPGVIDNHNQIHYSRRFLNMKLGITHKYRIEYCRPLFHELQNYLDLIFDKSTRLYLQTSCTKTNVFSFKRNPSICSIRPIDMKRPKIYFFLKKIVYKQFNSIHTIHAFKDIDWLEVITGKPNIFSDLINLLREHIFSKVMDKIKLSGIRITKLMLNYLRDSSCLGDSDATYILAMSYFYGIGEASINTSMVLELLLINAGDYSHRLSLLALGNIHNLQLIPVAASLSSVFYKTVADPTPKDIESFEKKDMFNDNIRLTNEDHIKEHTDENGDLFEWIKHQAASGLPWAKQRLGRILYWGGQGIRRNLNMAMDFFRMAAEAPDARAVDHYDYGLLLVKKATKTEDLEKGKSELQKASEKDPRALTALGWLAEVEEKNISKALEYYKKAYSMGNPDAGYNLGIFYHYGQSPLVAKNKVLAFQLFQDAAVKMQQHAAVMYSHYLLSGLTGVILRNNAIAINWARYVGENNPKIGYYLSEGVRAYRKKEKELSILYYLLAAFSGIELANFNVALICEDEEDLVKEFVKKECTWYHYNLSIQREEHHVHPYSLIKMGDNYWYGCLNGQRDITKSIEFYIRAAKKAEPRAFYNLAFIMENHNLQISSQLLSEIVRLSNVKNNTFMDLRNKVIHKLYERCEDFSEKDTYLPCRLASQRLIISELCTIIKPKIQILATVVMSAVISYKFIRLWRNRQEINDNLSNP